MKIGIIGAGAMGCLYACLLSEKNDVTLFDVSQNVVNAINADGIVCGTPEKKRPFTSPPHCPEVRRVPSTL